MCLELMTKPLSHWKMQKFEKVIFIKAICLLNDVFLKFNKVINKLMGGVSNDSKTLCRWSSVLC